MPVDYTTTVGHVRLLIPDTAVDDDSNYLFSDEQVETLLSLYGDNVKRAAAQAKDIIATDQVLLLKVVRTDDLTVDGAKVATELRLQAKALRDQADNEDGDYFNIVYPYGSVAWPEGTIPRYGRQLTVGEVPWPAV
jgi:hypothetical protein